MLSSSSTGLVCEACVDLIVVSEDISEFSILLQIPSDITQNGRIIIRQLRCGNCVLDQQMPGRDLLLDEDRCNCLEGRQVDRVGASGHQVLSHDRHSVGPLTGHLDEESTVRWYE